MAQELKRTDDINLNHKRTHTGFSLGGSFMNIISAVKHLPTAHHLGLPGGRPKTSKSLAVLATSQTLGKGEKPIPIIFCIMPIMTLS